MNSDKQTGGAQLPNDSQHTNEELIHRLEASISLPLPGIKLYSGIKSDIRTLLNSHAANQAKIAKLEGALEELVGAALATDRTMSSVAQALKNIGRPDLAERLIDANTDARSARFGLSSSTPSQDPRVDKLEADKAELSYGLAELLAHAESVQRTTGFGHRQVMNNARALISKHQS